MYVKLPPRELNPNPYLLHSTNTYTCGMIIASKVCGGESSPHEYKDNISKALN